MLLNHKTIGKNPSCLSPDFRNVRMPSRDCAKISKRQFVNRLVSILSRHITIRSLLKCSHTRFFSHITKRSLCNITHRDLFWLFCLFISFLRFWFANIWESHAKWIALAYNCMHFDDCLYIPTPQLRLASIESVFIENPSQEGTRFLSLVKITSLWCKLWKGLYWNTEKAIVTWCISLKWKFNI